jgi:hypothetical protein
MLAAMRRLALLLACVCVLAGTASAALPVPRLIVTEGSGVVVRGIHFLPRERITLTLVAGGRFRQTLFATSRGTFAARFRAATTDECSGYVASARGIHGSRAVTRVTRNCPTQAIPTPR